MKTKVTVVIEHSTAPTQEVAEWVKQALDHEIDETSPEDWWDCEFPEVSVSDGELIR